VDQIGGRHFRIQKAATVLRERLAYPADKKIELVEYRNGQRSVSLWEQINPKAAQQEELLRTGATYFVTGNPCDLGLRFVWSSHNAMQQTLFWQPQSPLSQKQNSQLATLQQAGAKIHVVKRGQFFKEDLVKAAGSIGKIRGVIDLGQIGARHSPSDGVQDSGHASMSMVERVWKIKPLVNPIATRFKRQLHNTGQRQFR